MTDETHGRLQRYEIFGRTAVLTFDTWAEVHLPNGVVISSLPEPHPAYEAKAHAHGFPDGLAMCKAHDRLHALVASALGLPHSPALMAVATGQFAGSELTGAEEDAVMALHRFINLCKREGLMP